jgi:hypothetical protein
MAQSRSIGFIVGALITGGLITAACFAEALTPAYASPVPIGATAHPIDVLSDAGPWLTDVPGACGAARQGGGGQFLDVFLHQLAARPALSQGLERALQGQGAGGGGRPRARIPVRA